MDGTRDGVMKRASGFATLVMLASTSVLAGQQRKLFDPVDLVNLKQVRDPQISPDGSLIAYVVETPVASGERRNAQIWLVSADGRSEEHTSELQSLTNLVCRLLLEKKKKKKQR